MQVQKFPRKVKVVGGTQPPSDGACTFLTASGSESRGLNPKATGHISQVTGLSHYAIQAERQVLKRVMLKTHKAVCPARSPLRHLKDVEGFV